LNQPFLQAKKTTPLRSIPEKNGGILERSITKAEISRT
jgi:hypothetical protein